MTDELIKIALVDDHVLLRNGLASLIATFGDYQVLYEANNGRDFISILDPANLPGVVLLDINMPEIDGYDTAYWLRETHPEIKVLALSMYDNEMAIIRMLKNGARGYILKDCETADLKAAIDAVVHKGYFYSDDVTGKMIHTLQKSDGKLSISSGITEREIVFLKYVCTEMTYKQIADCMFLSPRTIDGYRDTLFEKLSVKTRIGLVLFAIRNGIVNV